MRGFLRALQGAFVFQRGRALAAVLAVALAVPYWWADEIDTPGTPQVLQWAAAPAAAFRQWMFDAYQHLWPRRRVNQPVVLVEIDEASLNAVGQWPWPRSQLAALVDVLARAQPAAIGLDLYMPEPDQTSPVQVARRLTAAQPDLAHALSALPDHDELLANALRGAPSVLGIAGFDYETMATKAGVRLRPIQSDRAADVLTRVRPFPYALASLPLFQAAAQGQGVLSLGARDVVVRRIPLVAGVAGQLAPSLTMELLRVASGAAAITAHADERGVRAVEVADLLVSTQPNGEIWLHFAREADPASAPLHRLSAGALLGGSAPDLGELSGRLVLVGLTGSGLTDMRATARGDLIPGIEIQAQVLESLLARQWLERPWWLRWAELGLLALGAALMIWGIPKAHDARMGRRRIRWGWLVFFTCVGVALAGPLLFLNARLLADPLGIVGLWALVAASLASSGMLEIESTNVRLAGEREQLREAAARVAGELEAARRIQQGALPDARRVLEGESRFDVAALVQPAREVGGDLYDFFPIDEGRSLCFLVGDVSGKGVPASIFMTMTRTLCKSFALRSHQGPQAVMDSLNRDLARENSEWMFVTLVLCVLDLQRGRLTLVNAGHEPPLLRRADGSLQRVGGTDGSSASGPPLCFVDDYPYRSFETTLAPGDMLCLFSDGITEATSGDGVPYGVQRLGDSLVRHGAKGQRMAQVLEHLCNDVEAFAGSSEWADDLTLLVLQWHGPGAFSGG